MSKLGFIVGVGVGYVLGAKAGRRRYEQIKARADKVWQSPTVQHKVNDATQVVRDKAPELQHKVAAVAKDAGSAVKAKVSGSDHSGTGTPGSDTSVASATDEPGTTVPVDLKPARCARPACSDQSAERAGGVLGWFPWSTTPAPRTSTSWRTSPRGSC